MSGWEFLHPERVHLLWASGGLLLLLLRREARRRDILTRFVDRPMLDRLAIRASRRGALTRVAFVGLASLLAILAVMRPQDRSTTEAIESREASAEVMVLLDVSRSMLAEDAAPNRLERAKAEIRDLIRALKGHRVGLTVFAGRSVVLCPLTADHGFFRLMLDGASPASVTRGGTLIGDALRKAVKGFSSGTGARIILLVTDGEDHDSYPLDAAKEAAAQGIPIVSIGFGDEKGGEIPIVDRRTGARTMLTDREGRVVRTRLDGGTLRQIALSTQGAYIPAGVGVLDLESILQEHLRPLLRDASPGTVRTVRSERYQGFVLGTIGFLLASTLVGVPGGKEMR